jgi:hypothetical protein
MCGVSIEMFDVFLMSAVHAEVAQNEKTQFSDTNNFFLCVAFGPDSGSWPPFKGLKDHIQTHHTPQVCSGRVINPT